MSKPMRIGLIGLGNIGAGVLRTLDTNAETIAGRIARPLHLTRIADMDTTIRRDVPYDPAIMCADAMDLIGDSDIDVIIELIGGLEPARTFVEKSLQAGKHVVTANKAMMAIHGPELLAEAESKGVGLL